MSAPRFLRADLNPHFSGGDLGDAFQLFVRDVFITSYPGIHVFPGGGKDGGIDLSCSKGSIRTVFECKQIGSDGLEEAQKRWRKVATNLAKHLADPSGPTAGQSQYKPWYDTAILISEYYFVISSLLKNQEQHDSLRNEIETFFKGLARAHPHLAHLQPAALPGRVVDDLLGQRSSTKDMRRMPARRSSHCARGTRLRSRSSPRPRWSSAFGIVAARRRSCRGWCSP